MKKAKLVISEKLSNILDSLYYLTYPENEDLGEDDIEWLFNQLYRKGHEDAIDRVDSAIEDVKNKMVEKYENTMDCRKLCQRKELS
jgi:hypothetical protein